MHRIRVGVLTTEEHLDKLMRQMRVRAAVTSALREGKVIFAFISAVNAALSQGTPLSRESQTRASLPCGR